MLGGQASLEQSELTNSQLQQELKRQTSHTLFLKQVRDDARGYSSQSKKLHTSKKLMRNTPFAYANNRLQARGGGISEEGWGGV